MRSTTVERIRRLQKKLQGPDGTGLKNLTNNPATDSGPSWSPDGRRLAFSSDRYADQDEIPLLDLADGSTIRLTDGAK